MRWKIELTIRDQTNNQISHFVSGTIEISKSGAFAYGNRKYLAIKWNNHLLGDDFVYDIRYDKRYTEASEKDYVRQFILDWFSDPSRVENICVTPLK